MIQAELLKPTGRTDRPPLETEVPISSAEPNFRAHGWTTRTEEGYSMLSFKRLLQHAMIGAVACTSATQASTILIGDDLELQSAAFDELFDNCGGCAPGDFSDVDSRLVISWIARST